MRAGFRGRSNQSKSGERRCAGLKRWMHRVHMSELGVVRQVQKLERLRQQQQRRCGEQHVVCKRDDGADRAGIGRFLIAMIGGLLLLRGLIAHVWRGEAEIGLRQAGWDRRRRVCCGPMEMPVRQRKLDREREQREPRAKFDVFSKPLHESYALPRGGSESSAVPMLYYNIG